MDLLQEGTYMAKPVNWGVNEYQNKDGKKLKLFIKFDNGLSWQGYPEGSDGAYKQVTNTLKALSFTGSTLRQFAEDRNCLDIETPVEISVKHESFVSRDGTPKTVAKVAFVGGLGVDEELLARLEAFTIELATADSIPF